MSGKLVTVIMPIYNSERFLADAIESVVNQSYSNLEILLIDDCSTDNSSVIAKKYVTRDKRVKYLINDVNQGVAKTRNRGIHEANGEYIALLDSDDIWVENKIELQIRLLEETNSQIAYCSYDFIDENSKNILSPYLVPQTTDFENMLFENVIGCSTVFALRELLEKHMFKSNVYHEDYVLWMECLKEGARAQGIEQVLVHYRKVSGSRSDNKINAAKQRWKIYRENLNLSLTKSMVSFVKYALSGVKKHYIS